MSRQWLIPLVLLPYVGLLCYFILQMNLAAAMALAVFPLALWIGSLFAIDFKSFLLATVFFVPLSLGVKDIGGGLGLSLPSEPMLALGGLGAFFLLLREGLPFRRLFGHPIVLVVLLQHAWAFFTTLGSTESMASAKFFTIRSLFLLVYFFCFLHIFKERKGARQFFWAYILGLVPVLLWAIFKLSRIGFGRKYAPDMGEPFFDDHTILGAVIAMLLPVCWMFFRQRMVLWNGLAARKWLGPVLFLLVVGFVLTFSRAAWMSIVFAGVFFIFLRFKVKFSAILTGFLVLLALGFVFREDLVERMRKNENVSGEDIVMMAKSVTNVSTDESNQERVNRWSCAVRMWEDRPWTGFGPASYEQVYPAYQIKAEMTRISSKEGDRGDAHSEYLTALSEQGLPGLLIFILLAFVTVRTGMRIVYRSGSPAHRRLAQAVLLGLLTFYVHALANSFLDLDEAATLFWGMTSLLVALDLGEAKFPIFSTLEGKESEVETH